MIYLIGFMGSGKTTVGKILHQKLHKKYTDTDLYVEQMTGQTISQIFAKAGEKGFRTYESLALQRITSGVVSTGGGIVEIPDNTACMKSNGIVVFLKASLQTIEGRLQDDQTRPLWNQSVTQRKDLFSRRERLYEEAADIVVETDDKTATEITEEILFKLENRKKLHCR